MAGSVSRHGTGALTSVSNVCDNVCDIESGAVTFGISSNSVQRCRLSERVASLVPSARQPLVLLHGHGGPNLSAVASFY
jgi:hypothetical protein